MLVGHRPQNKAYNTPLTLSGLVRDAGLGWYVTDRHPPLKAQIEQALFVPEDLIGAELQIPGISRFGHFIGMIAEGRLDGEQRYAAVGHVAGKRAI